MYPRLLKYAHKGCSSHKITRIIDVPINNSNFSANDTFSFNGTFTSNTAATAHGV